LKEFELFLTKV